MMSAGGPVSVRYLLLGSDQATIDNVLAPTVEDRGVGALVSRAIGGLGHAGQKAVCDEVAHVADTLLDLDVSDVLAHAWNKNRLISSARERTVADPDTEELVELATHTVRSRHQPSVEVFVDDLLITTVTLTLSLTLVVHGLLVVVEGGHLTGLRSGTCEATASLHCESALLAEGTHTFSIPGAVRLRDDRRAPEVDQIARG
jgi:hypothetical protein